MVSPPPLSASTKAAAASPYPDSVDCSPRSRHNDSRVTYTASPTKLRLMCSYGGHIIPRPHDKSLCYISGDTRIIVIERNTSLSDLHHRLSKTLLNNQPFILKYQLPNEELDSLISVATDEDLENMVDEYNRLNTNSDSSKRKPGRLRLFLFPKLPMNSAEQLLVETASTKSEEWFLDALNGKRTLSGSDLGFSESSSVNCLLGLDDDIGAKAAAMLKDVEGSKNGPSIVNHDVHSVPDSPMLETTSSFGSTSSSPSAVANLPPIKAGVEESPILGIEDQFQQMSVGIMANNVNFPVVQKQEEVFGCLAAAGQVVVGGEYANRVISEDERSDHGGYRLVQQIQTHVQLQQHQISQLQQKQTSAFDLYSPDSVSRQGQSVYQEPPYMQIQSGNMANQVDLKSGDQNIRTNSNVQTQHQVQESGYVLSGHYDQNQPQLHQPQQFIHHDQNHPQLHQPQQFIHPDQNHPQLHQPQQFIHPGAQFIPAGAVPMPQYYQIYPPRQEQQYPVYFMPTRQSQSYSLPMQQPNYSELAQNAHTSQPQTPPSATIAPPSAYTQTRIAPSSNTEMPVGAYRTVTPQLVQVPSSQQHQTQYVAQFHHPSQSMAQTPEGANPPYNYEFADSMQRQIYYSRALPPQMAAQYQTLTSAPNTMLPEASAQLPTEKVRTLQP